MIINIIFMYISRSLFFNILNLDVRIGRKIFLPLRINIYFFSFYNLDIIYCFTLVKVYILHI